MSKTEEQRFILKHFFIGKLLNLPIFAFFWMINFMLLSAVLEETYNAYLIEDWLRLLSTTFTLCLVLSTQQAFGWNYWHKQLTKLGDSNRNRQVMTWIGIELFLVSLLTSAYMLDFSPEAKEEAYNHKQEQVLKKERLLAYQSHLKVLPTDVTTQSLGAYLLSLEAGESFINYLHLSDELSDTASLKAELELIKANPHQNKVLTYLTSLNSEMGSGQYRELAMALYEDNGLSFMSLLNEPFDEPKSFVKNQLYAHILGFELAYFQENLVLFWRDDVDIHYMEQIIEGILFRLDHAETLSRLGRGDLEFLTSHRNFFNDCLDLLKAGPSVVQDRLNSYEDEFSIIYSDKEPYEGVADFLSGSNFSH